MTPPDDLQVFVPLEAGPDESNALVAELSKQGMVLVHCEAGWSLVNNCLCYGHWFHFRPATGGN